MQSFFFKNILIFNVSIMDANFQILTLAQQKLKENKYPDKRRELHFSKISMF